MRVRRRSEFRAVQAACHKVTTRHFVFLLHVRKEAESGHPRLGITASRRVGHAPHRNRAKRLVREAYRATRDWWPHGLDLVVIVRWLEPTTRLDDVVREWQRVLPALQREFSRLGLAAGLDVAREADHTAPSDLPIAAGTVRGPKETELN